MGIDTVQWRAAIRTFISSRKDMEELEKDKNSFNFYWNAFLFRKPVI